MIKDDVLRELEENKGQYISGSEMASRLGVSRNAIWKTIKSLEKKGYIIDSVPRLGYALSDESDILSSFFVFVNTYFVVCGNFSVFLVDFADGHLMDNLPAMASFLASQYIIFFEQICFLYHFISTIMAIFSSIYILIFLNVSFGIHSAPKTFAENSGMFLSPTFLKNLCIKKAAVCWTQAAAF